MTVLCFLLAQTIFLPLVNIQFMSSEAMHAKLLSFLSLWRGRKKFNLLKPVSKLPMAAIQWFSYPMADYVFQMDRPSLSLLSGPWISHKLFHSSLASNRSYDQFLFVWASACALWSYQCVESCPFANGIGWLCFLSRCSKIDLTMHHVLQRCR